MVWSCFETAYHDGLESGGHSRDPLARNPSSRTSARSERDPGPITTNVHHYDLVFAVIQTE
jgi:hypothetical protein